MFSTRPPLRLSFVVGSIVCLFVSASPTFRENDTTTEVIESTRRTRSIKLVYKKNEFLEMEARGFIPAWVDSQGLMRTPSTEIGADVQLDSSRSDSKVIEQLIDHHYSVVVPFTHPTSDVNPKAGSFLNQLKEFIPSLRHHPAMKLGSRAEKISYPILPTEECTECDVKFLAPTMTYADGSDIFKYDIYDMSRSYPDEFNESNVALPPGCYFAEDYEGHLICSNPFLTKVPDLPREPLSIFEMNNTNVRTLESWSFNQLDVVVMKLDGNSIKTIEPDAFYGINGLLSLSVRKNSIQSLDWTQFNGLSQLLVLSLRGNKINLTDSFLEPPKNDTLFLPGLAHLDLSDNPLEELNEFVFWPLRDSPIVELNLKSCKLSTIHPGKKTCNFSFFSSLGYSD